MSKEWTEEEDFYLREAWRDGESASLISKGLGNRSRCAVLGRVHRLGLEIRSQKTVRTHSPRVKPPPKKSVKAQDAVVLANGDPGPLDPTLTLETLSDAHCKWPYDGQGETTYCGRAPVDRKLPYCEYHRAERRNKNQTPWGARSQKKV